MAPSFPPSAHTRACAHGRRCAEGCAFGSIAAGLENSADHFTSHLIDSTICLAVSMLSKFINPTTNMIVLKQGPNPKVYKTITTLTHFAQFPENDMFCN